MNFSHYAIVTDGVWRKSLSAIRSLGKAGFHVIVMGDSLFTTGFWSRYTQNRIIAPVASVELMGFGNSMLDTLRGFNEECIPVLFPMEDASLMWVARNIESVRKYAHILIPPLESLEIAQDKSRTIQIAEEIGIPYPRTWKFSKLSDFLDTVYKLQGISFVVKPRISSGSAGVIYGNPFTPEQWKKHWEHYGRLIIQERIPSEGHGLGVGLLMDNNNECVAQFAYERLHEYPITGGPSTDRKSIYNAVLVEQSIKLLKRLNWKGVAMVEWKLDINTGIHKLIEINPRFWGSLELSIRAGVNFPVLYAKTAIGEKVEPVLDYKENIRCRWMVPGDILRFLNQPKEEREKLRDFLKGLPSSTEEWDKTDIRGSIASVICPALLVLNPRYWKYLRR